MSIGTPRFPLGSCTDTIKAARLHYALTIQPYMNVSFCICKLYFLLLRAQHNVNTGVQGAHVLKKHKAPLKA